MEQAPSLIQVTRSLLMLENKKAVSFYEMALGNL